MNLLGILGLILIIVGVYFVITGFLIGGVVAVLLGLLLAGYIGTGIRGGRL